MKCLVVSIALFLTAELALAEERAFPDAVTADPKHYTVEFENDILRILRIKYAPGDASVMHSHDASCAIFLADGAMRMELPDGTSSVAPANAPGTVDCNDANAHRPTNTGDTAVELLLVEMKGRKTAK